MKKVLAIIIGLGFLGLPSFSEDGWTRSWRVAAQTQAYPGVSLSAVRVPDMFGALASEGLKTEMDRIRKQRLISGLCLAGAWTATVLVDLLYEDGYRKYTVIPVVGPFVTIAAIESAGVGYWPGAKALLIASGVAQCALATYFVISLGKHPKSGRTARIEAFPSVCGVNLRVQF